MALAIVGLGLVAVFGQLNQTLIAASIMRDRTLAHWVAMNRLAELRLSGELPEVGERSDEVEMGGVEWSYELKFSEVGLENIRRVDVAVSFADSPDRVVTELIGILGKSPQQAAPAVWTPLDPNAEFAGGEQQ